MSCLAALSASARPSRPAMTRSAASLISSSVISFLFRRAVRMADSFIRFSRSAPLKPAVRLATSVSFISSAILLFFRCTFRICSRPFTSGKPTVTRRSKRPGRRSALSRISERLVAATTMTPVFPSNPSISVRIWFSVCSRSSFPPPMPAPRCLPIASISSMKMMQGAFSLACLKISRTREAPTPTKSSMNSEAEAWMNGTPDSPARAFAINVLPVPGGPVSNTPLGILAPTFTKRSGALRKSTISVSSSFASSIPATSSNFTPVSGVTITLALVWFPNPGMPPGPLPARLRRKRRPAMTSSGKATSPRTLSSSLGFSGVCTSMDTPLLWSLSSRPVVAPGRSHTSCCSRSPTLTRATAERPESYKSTRRTDPSSTNSNSRE
mmetsp:Transcript_22299/g.66992  ORF Transcript_22299/g.66992 Transcript_22299/m.66992 type:complete len:382 (-) Transcript_22299:614-1759(-)